MRPWLPALLALSVVSQGAGQDEKSGKKTPASSLLPDGSQLHGVVIPRHNKQYQLVNSLIAEVVTLVNDEMISGERVVIDFYDKAGQRSAQIKLQEANFKQSVGMLHASETVTIDANEYQARGKGLHYAMNSGRGLLEGPVITWMQNPPQTAMKPKTPSLIGAAGVALVAQTGALADGQATDKPEPVRINTVNERPISQDFKEAKQQLKDALDASSTTDAEVKQFIEETPLDYEKITGSKPTPPNAEPLDFKPGPDHTVIDCNGGMYFDSDKGQLVYLQDVKVTDPEFILTGADVLRIYMSKSQPKAKPTSKDKPAPKESEDPKAKKGGPVPAIGGDFDSIEKIVATGAVRVLQKAVAKGKEPVEASGALLTYHPETGDILISGGYPWVKQGDYFARAKEPNLTLRIKKDGKFVTEGKWQMGGRRNQR